MKRSLIAAALALASFSALTSPAEARPRHHAAPTAGGYDVSPFGDHGLVARARAYLGTNPTGWAHVWCGRFLAMIAPEAAAKVRNPNRAKDWLALPRTSARVGAIAVMNRRGGGHVGIVSGFDAAGNPVIVSGNAGGHRVREGVYPRSRVLAFVRAP